MADHDNENEVHEDDDEKPVEKLRKHDSGAADLQKVTDYAEEKEIASGDIKGVRSDLLN
jgi:hypothetical protein